MAVHNPEDVKDMTDAPLGVECVWKAKNGKYVNVALLLKTGKMDDSSQGQTIALRVGGTPCRQQTDKGGGNRKEPYVIWRFGHNQYIKC